MRTDLEYRIAKLEAKPGDVLVLKCDKVLTLEAERYLRENLNRTVLPLGVKVIVLDRGVDLSVLTAAEIQARAA